MDGCVGVNQVACQEEERRYAQRPLQTRLRPAAVEAIGQECTERSSGDEQARVPAALSGKTELLEVTVA